MQTRKNILASAKEVNTAKPLRCYIDTILKQIADDLNDQKNATNEALKRRIDETRMAKIKLEEQHSEVKNLLASLAHSRRALRAPLASLARMSAPGARVQMVVALRAPTYMNFAPRAQCCVLHSA